MAIPTLRSCVVLLSACAAFAVAALAQEPQAVPTESTAPPVAENPPAPATSPAPAEVAPAVVPETMPPAPPDAFGDPKEVEAYFDGVINTVMRERQIPGAVFVLVRNGATLLSKGYGYADDSKKAPVLPDSTLFRIASVSKTINATAVMQLVEQGKLDLNAPVNDLLEKYNARMTIPQHYSEPIRLIDLLNHTAGFDERGIGMARLRKEDVPPLGKYLTLRMPPQTMPPRATTSYSNHGVALSGWLVQLAADAPYNAYIRDNIFTPLGMSHSTFALTDDSLPNVAQGYYVKDAQVKQVPIDFLTTSPAGEMYSSGDDMAKFMIAHLQNGRLGETRILQESTAIEMHRLHYQQDSRLAGGMAVSFFTTTRNGHRIIEHGGDLNGFASELWLMPDDNVGFFTSCNVDDGKLRTAVTRAFMDRFYPTPKAERSSTQASSAKDMAKYAGYYRFNRYARRSIEKLTTLTNQGHVTFENGELVLRGFGEQSVRLAEDAPGVFKDARSGLQVVFRTDSSGNVTHMLMDALAFEKLPWYEVATWHALYIIGTILLLASAVVFWPLARLLRRARAVRLPSAPARYRVIVWSLATLSLYLLITFGYVITTLDPWEFTYGMPTRIILLLCIPPFLAVGAVIGLFHALAAWWHGYWSGWTRIHYTLVVLACALLLPYLHYWNLIGFNW